MYPSRRSRASLPSMASTMLALSALLLLSNGVDRVASFPLAPALTRPSAPMHPSTVISPMPEAGSIVRLRTVRLFSTPDDEEADNSNDTDAPEAEVVADSLTESQIESLKGESSHFLSTLRGFFANKKKFNRESLGKLGVSALLAYGFVSNVSGVLAVSSAWFIFSKKTGLSPMSPGQKPAFLAIYAGFTVMLNVIRPARFAFAMAISPYFERIRKSISNKFGVSPRGAAVVMVVFVNLLGTCSLMAMGVGLASLLSGVPVWAGR